MSNYLLELDILIAEALFNGDAETYRKLIAEYNQLISKL